MRSFASSASLAALTALALIDSVCAQTPGQMQYEQQQREYWRQQEQQRQEQQRQQQLMDENARRGQGSSNANAPSSGGTGGGGGGYGGGAGGGGADAAAWDAARAKWLKQPPLPPDKNPLLGKWMRPASARGNSNDPFAGLMALAKGGMCEVLFGGPGAVFEFKPDRLTGKDAQTPEQELDRVEYRGDAKRVAVLPKKSIKLIEFDFDGPDRISWSGQNCVLVRAGSTSAAAPAAPSSGGAAKAASTPSAPAAAGGGGGVLAFSVGEPTWGNPVAGRKFWVLKSDAQVALIKGGIQSTPYASVLQNWMRACLAHAPDCEKGAMALKPYSVGIATSDTAGHAKTPMLPAGRYWVLSDAKVDNKHVMWNVPIDVNTGEKVVTLDRRNAMPVD